MDKAQILLVDDEETIHLVVERTLRRENFEILYAKNGLEGLELLKKNQPSVIILDLQMPQMDGIAFLKKINLKPDDPYAVLILTGHGSDDEMQECYDLGAHLFLRKPFGYTEFLCQVQRLIRLKQLEAKVKQDAIDHKMSFSNNISHELRTPLNIIFGSLGLIDQNLLPEKQKQYLGFIHSASESLLEIVNQILRHKKCGTEKDSVNIEKIDFFSFCLEISGKYKKKAEDKNLNYSHEFSDYLPKTIFLDKEYLSIILSEILDNAIKYTDKGHIFFKVNVSEDILPPQEIRFEISDSGIGIPEENKTLVFEQFRQLDDSTTRSKGGVGLGLSLVKNHVESLNGSIEIESEINKGSTFIVTLPLSAKKVN